MSQAMSQRETSITHSALGWVKKSIDDNLSEIEVDLKRYIEAENDELLQRVKERLGVIHGVLMMIEKYGAAMLTEEMVALTDFIGENRKEKGEQALEVLLRAVLQLPDYLEHIQSGHRDIPIAILPLLNDIRSVRNQDLFSEKLLFLPDLSMHQKGAEIEDIDEKQNQASKMIAKKLRPVYQLALVNIIKEQSVEESLKKLEKICQTLEERSFSEQVARIWWIIGALIESVSRQQLELGVSIKNLLGKVDALFRVILIIGERGLLRRQPIELIKNFLYYIAQPECDGPKTQAIKTAYRLEQFLPSESARSELLNNIAGPNQALMKTVAEAMKADIESVKATLEVYVNGDLSRVSALKDLPQEMHVISDTLAMIGLGSQRQLVEAQIEVVKDILDGNKAAEEEQLLSMAAELIQIEQALDQMPKRHPAGPSDESASSSGVSRDYELDSVLTAVVTAGLDNIQKTKNAIIEFIKDSSHSENIDYSIAMMEEARGAMQLLDQPRAVAVVDGLLTYLRGYDIVEFMESSRLDALSQVVVSLEYYLEALGEHRSDAESILDLADIQLKELLANVHLKQEGDETQLLVLVDDENSGDGSEDAGIEAEAEVEAGLAESRDEDAGRPEPAAEAPPGAEQPEAAKPVPEAGTVTMAMPVALDTSVMQIEEIHALKDQPQRKASEKPGETAKTPVSPAGEKPAISPEEMLEVEPVEEDLEVLKPGSDPEILEIYLEEAQEEAQNIARMQKDWALHPEDENAYKNIRRAFHTIKGSGRLVGAIKIGEFAWDYEQLLNRVIDKTIAPDEKVIEAVGKAGKALPELINELTTGEKPRARIAYLRGLARALAEFKAEQLLVEHTQMMQAVQMNREQDGDDDEGPQPFGISTTQVVPQELIRKSQDATEKAVAQAAKQDGFEDTQLMDAGEDLESTQLMDPSEAPTEEAREEADAEVEFGETEVSFADAPTQYTQAIDYAPVMAESADEEPEEPEPELPDEIESESLQADDRQQITVETVGEDFVAEDFADDHDASADRIAFGSPPSGFDSPQSGGGEAPAEDAGAEAVAMETMDEEPDSDEIVMQTLNEEPESDEIVMQTLEEEPESDEIVMQTPEEEPESDEIVMQTPEEEPGSDEIVMQTPEEEPGSDEIVMQTPEEEPGSDEIVMQTPDEEPDSDEIVMQTLDEEPDSDEIVMQTPEEEPDSDEIVMQTPEEEPDSDEIVMQTPEEESGWDETVMPTESPDDGETSADESAVYAENQPVDGPDAEQETPPDPFVETKTGLLPGREAGASLSAEKEPQEPTGLSFDPELLIIYQQEVEQHLGIVSSALDRAEKIQELIPSEEIYRALHTIHGASRTADISTIGELADLMERPLKEAIGQKLALDMEIVSLYRQGQHAIQSMTAELVEARQLPPIPADLKTSFQALAADFREHTVELPEDEPGTSGGFVDTLTMMSEAVAGGQDDELLEIFVDEANELLEMSDNTLHEWAAQSGDDKAAQEYAAVMELQRYLHTLKGGARMAELSEISDLSHELESMFIAVIDGRVEKSDELIELLKDSFDLLHRQVIEARQGQNMSDSAAMVDMLRNLRLDEDERGYEDSVEESTEVDREDINIVSENLPEEPLTGPERQSQDVIKVRADLLDNLVSSAGEVSIYRARMEQQVAGLGSYLGELGQTISRLKSQLRSLEAETDAQIHFSHRAEASRSDFDPLEMDRYTLIQELSRSLSESVNDLSSLQVMLGDQVKDSETLLLQQSRVNTDLQDGLIKSRMVRFSGLLSRLRRLVRQSSQELGKKAELVITGEENEVDNKVLDRMVAPLEHIIRNALSHGIETPVERVKKGKPEAGRIGIDITRDGSEVVIKVSDDGAGVDIEKVRSRAIKLGLLDKSQPVSDADLVQYILEPGFSTAEHVTQLSGRGVGMDVVDIEIKQLGGTLQIETNPAGTTFIARLPFTLSINQAILVRTGDETYAIPLINIEGITRLDTARLLEYYREEAPELEYAGQQFALHSLSKLVGQDIPFQPAPDEQKQPVILSRAGDIRVALHVDEVLGNREIVVKNLGKQLSQVKGLAGASILADGSVVLILDVNGLVRQSVANAVKIVYQPERASSPKTRDTVMVVDDSITMRRVASKLLERHNYKVITAKDGVDALAQLQDVHPDVMLLDIEMPRMDGFELAAHMQNEANFSSIPIIMITSRTGEKHRDRALEIGVANYMGKPYQEEELIENIQSALAR
jgi:chemosensory pili system protein ChpA (sensor histidine kinase/response regulator)